jgi:hypothetical protein
MSVLSQRFYEAKLVPDALIGLNDGFLNGGELVIE